MNNTTTAPAATFGGNGSYAIRAYATPANNGTSVISNRSKPREVAPGLFDFQVSIHEANRTTATVGCFTRIIEIMGWNVEKIAAVADEQGNVTHL